jgi:hypothetical protein
MIGGCEWFCGEDAKDQSAPPLLGQVWAHHYKVCPSSTLNIATFIRNHNLQYFSFILKRIAFPYSSSS